MGVEHIDGTVVEIHGVAVTVLPHGGGDRVRCRLPRQPRMPVIGDRVRCVRREGEVWLDAIEARERTFVRPHKKRPLTIATHVDRIVLVSAVRPPPRPGLVDRVLIAVNDPAIALTLVVNKCDLEGASEAVERLAHHRDRGRTILTASALDGTGVDALREHLATGLSVLMGHSGVGKSTLMNALIPDAGLKVGGVHAQTGKGKHTTTVSTCHELGPPWPEGGLLVDTPGVRTFSLGGLTPRDIAERFEDFAPWRATCRFSDCLHDTEPDCAIRDALAEGAISEERFAAYQRLVASLSEQR